MKNLRALIDEHESQEDTRVQSFETESEKSEELIQ